MNTNKVDWTAEVQSAVLAMKDEGRKAYTFMKQEAPEVANEYVRWQIVKGATAFGMFMVPMFAAICFSVVSYRKWARKVDGDWGFACGMFLIVAFAIFAMGVPCLMPALKAHIAPRITIIEGVKEVVK